MPKSQDAKPSNPPGDIVALGELEHVEQDANQNEQRWRCECEMCKAARKNVSARFEDGRQTQGRHSVDERDRDTQQQAGTQPARRVRCVQELLAGLMESRQRERVEQRRQRWTIS